ncbi:MAG: phosphonate monoester hydrolase [Anaerolineaceae bacterium]|nr:MAG: phosphonate monoester hydrolase [Anaerolineaceae bacterium]
MTAHPNIVIIIADDLRADALENPLVRTPHLAALRADGVTFAQNYAANPVCAPSRMANFTGLYPQVNGHRSLYQLLRPHEENLFRILKDNGYETVMAGKNDLMTTPSLRASFRRRLAGPQSVQLKLMRQRLRPLPLHRKWRLLALAFRLFVVERKSFSSLLGDERLKEFADVLPSARSPYPRGHRLHHSFYFGKVKPVSPAAQMEPLIFESAVRWLDSAPRQPFCLYVAATLPHTPYQVEEPYFSMYARAAIPDPIPAQLDDKPHFMRELYAHYELAQLTPEDLRELRATYYGMVAKLDEQVGRVVTALKAQGLYDDSLILFLSDHGDYVGDYGLVEKWPTGFQDNLLRVPLIVKYPANAHAGQRVDGFTQSLDLFPTVLEQAGIQTSYTHFGQSLTSLMEGIAEREAVYAVGGYDPREPQAFESGIQSGDDPLMGHYFEKLKLQQDDPATVARAAMLCTHAWKLVIRSAGKEELYDLKNDPQELYNRVDDPALSEVCNDLRERLLHWYLRASDNPHWEHERSI